MAKPLWFAYRHACDLRKVPECPRCMHASPPRLADRAHEKAGTEDNFLLVQWRIDWRIKPRCNRKHLCFGRAHRHCFDAGTPPCPTSACRSMQHRFDARASYVGVPEDHLLVYDLSTIVCAKRCVCSSSTCGVS